MFFLSWGRQNTSVLLTALLVDSYSSVWASCKRNINVCINIFLRWDFKDSNTDGSFTVSDSNSFLSPYEALLIAQNTNIYVHFREFVFIL